MTWENWAVAIALGALLVMVFLMMEMLYANARRDLEPKGGKEPEPRPTVSRG
jgi:hypothetical protein